jgi:hypothetical protein
LREKTERRNLSEGQVTARPISMRDKNEGGTNMAITIEYKGIHFNDKEAALLQIVFEHKEYEFRNRAMKTLEREGSVAALSCIANNHLESEFRNRAMKALENR